MSDAHDNQRWRADIAAYLLGSLEPQETAALETHLDGCERCRQELRWLQPAVDLLPESVEQLEPPPQLRERLLAEVGAETSVGRPEQAAERRKSGGGLQRFFLRPAVALGAVALVVAAVAGYSFGVAGGGDDGATATVATRGLGDLRATLEHNGDKGTLRMTGLQQAPSRHVYQAWVEHDGRIEPTPPLFDAQRDGTATIPLARNLEGADAVMVTIEPRGGSRQPSATPVVNLKIAD